MRIVLPASYRPKVYEALSRLVSEVGAGRQDPAFLRDTELGECVIEVILHPAPTGPDALRAGGGA